MFLPFYFANVIFLLFTQHLFLHWRLFYRFLEWFPRNTPFNLLQSWARMSQAFSRHWGAMERFWKAGHTDFLGLCNLPCDASSQLLTLFWSLQGLLRWQESWTSLMWLRSDRPRPPLGQRIYSVFHDAVNWHLDWWFFGFNALWFLCLFESFDLLCHSWRLKSVGNDNIGQIRGVPRCISPLFLSIRLVGPVNGIWVLTEGCELLLLLLSPVLVIKCSNLLLDINRKLVMHQFFRLLGLHQCELLCSYIIVCINKAWSFKMLILELHSFKTWRRVKLEIGKLEIAITSLLIKLLGFRVIYEFDTHTSKCILSWSHTYICFELPSWADLLVQVSIALFIDFELSTVINLRVA